MDVETLVAMRSLAEELRRIRHNPPKTVGAALPDGVTAIDTRDQDVPVCFTTPRAHTSVVEADVTCKRCLSLIAQAKRTTEADSVSADKEKNGGL